MSSSGALGLVSVGAVTSSVATIYMSAQTAAGFAAYAFVSVGKIISVADVQVYRRRLAARDHVS
jgi:hypothetical protein